jgi:hypothetical protein
MTASKGANMKNTNKLPAKNNARKYFFYAKFAIAGAMGGLAVVNTFFSSSSPETFAMGVGAITATLIVKALHII